MYCIFKCYRLMAEATMAIIHEGTVALDVMQVKVGYKYFNIISFKVLFKVGSLEWECFLNNFRNYLH